MTAATTIKEKVLYLWNIYLDLDYIAKTYNLILWVNDAVQNVL